ncbi:MAG: hypothetical protein ACRD4R_03500 [Candidatus Acidiferrales bacterium]
MKYKRTHLADMREILSLERQVLRAMCRDRAPSQIDRFLHQLSSYSWQKPEHATVFEAIRRLATRARDSWRKELPAQATRMGFPDVEWPDYLEVGDGDESEPSLDGLIPRLLRYGARKPKR